MFFQWQKVKPVMSDSFRIRLTYMVHALNSPMARLIPCIFVVLPDPTARCYWLS